MNRSISLLTLTLLMTLSACGGGGDAGTTTDSARGSTASAEELDTNTGTTTPVMQTAKLNANTATAEQFKTIPGVGDKMVHEFEEYRPYASIQQFRKEIGKYADEAQVAAYENYLFIPIDYNASDAETLAQIPGLDAGEAGQVVAARPYASEAAFFEKLGAFVSPTELATARTYVVAN